MFGALGTTSTLQPRKQATVVKKQTVTKPTALPQNKPQSKAIDAIVRPKSSLTNGKPTTKQSKPLQKIANTRKRSTPSEDISRPARKSRTPRASPEIATPPPPRFSGSDDDDSEDEQNIRAKRQRVQATGIVDSKRKIRDRSSFSADDNQIPFIHAADFANSGTSYGLNPKYRTHWTALANEEDEDPTVTLKYPNTSQRESYQLVASIASDEFKPIEEIINVIKAVAQNYLTEEEADPILKEEGDGIVRRLDKARKEGALGHSVGSQTTFVNTLKRYNDMMVKFQADGTIARNIDALQSLSLPLVEFILQQVYARTVSREVHKLKAYENGTDDVYGELKPKFVDMLVRETKLKSDQVFVDLGSGVGNVVLQMALQVGCESWGCEKMPNPSALADSQTDEFRSRCKLWAIKPGEVYLEKADFLVNGNIKAALKRADVVLINNQAFTTELNERLKLLFLDLKEGCQVVSLKGFKPDNLKLHERNQSDVAHILKSKKMQYFSNCVSWKDEVGDWYVQTVDRTELESFKGTRG